MTNGTTTELETRVAAVWAAHTGQDGSLFAESVVASFRDNVRWLGREEAADFATELVGEFWPWGREDDDEGTANVVAETEAALLAD